MRLGCCVVALVAMALCDCNRQTNTLNAENVTGGNAKVGRHLIYAYGCGTCHTIPGVAEANAMIGPSLDGVGARIYIAGSLRNTPSNLSRWIAQPQEINAGTAMPDLGVTNEQARDIAAYLYTLQ